MSHSDPTLVIGADSLIGDALIQTCRAAGDTVLGTTRRPARVSGDRLLLDLADDEPWLRLDRRPGVAFIVAAFASYSGCETDPVSAKVNVVNIPAIGEMLMRHGAFVVFVSTNTVFGGERPFPNEDDALAPGIAYARQKAAAEIALREAAGRVDAHDRLAIVRLTKVLAPTTSPLPDWFASLDAGHVIRPFSDLIFAPVSLEYVASSLRHVGMARRPGHFHLSGAANVAYNVFAASVVATLGLPADLVHPTTAQAEGVTIAFNPRYSALGMQRTTATLGITPQPFHRVVDYLVSSRR